MHLKRLLAAWLCVSLAVPPQAYAQASAASGPSANVDAHAAVSSLAPDAPALVSGPLDDEPEPMLPASVAQGVFGTYGGAQNLFSSPSAPSGARSNTSVRPGIWVPQLPDLGDGSGGALTPQAERKVGERVMREIRRDPDYIGDWLVRDYLNSVAARLADAANAQFIGGYRPDFELFAIHDGEINAFSLPGGFIGVNSGLIVATQTESELASVLGHEMGHVLQRHIARMLSQSERTGYAALAGILFGILAGVLARSGDLGSAIALGSEAYGVDSQLRFSRAAEHEADRVGFRLLAGAGYDPYGMAAFFERLERASMGDAGVPAYARTHPLNTERIVDMQDRARRSAYRQPRQAPEYGFVRARVRVLQDRTRGDWIDEVARLRSEIDDRTALNVAANWYGVAFAQMLLERYDDASASLAKSRATFGAFEAADGSKIRSSPSLDVLAAEIALRAGRGDEAVQLAAASHKVWPESHAATDGLLRALLNTRRFREAQTLARAQTVSEPQQPTWWQYLAQASVGLGDGLEQRRALAEKFALDGAWPSAIRQLKEARDMKSVGYYDLSMINARLHEFEARYKEDREDEKDRS
jgi:beta-barrel assembly-enhancing protease